MAESGDTYSNEGDSYAPEGMGDDPGSLEHAQKVGTYAMRRRRPAIFSVRLCLVSHAPSRCTFWLVLHAWQMCVPMSKFFMLLWPTVVVQLWQLCTTLHRAARGRDHKVPR